jgi:Cupredoxin-like domain
LTLVGSIRADVSKRPFALVAGLAILAAACSNVPTASTIDYGTGPRFVTTVADTVDNVGLASSVAVDGNGSPFISYFGFPATVKPSQIPIPRPIGTPFLPGVLLTTVDQQGMWTQGAIEQNKPAVEPQGVTVPFGPVTTEKFALSPDDSNGTAIAVASDGTVHAAWTMADGVVYGTTKAGGSATVTPVFDSGTAVSLAGPMSVPGIALDADGKPWIAFSVMGPSGFEVHAARLQGSKWQDQIVVSEPACSGCPDPGPVGIRFLRGNPVVVFGDPVKHEVDTATLQGSNWVVDPVETNTDGLGLSVAVVGNTLYVSYFTGHGTVDVAILKDREPVTGEVGKSANPDASETGNDAARTAVTAGTDGTIYVAWDNGDSGVTFVSGGTNSFAPISLGPNASTSAHPALASSDSGVFLSWYDTLNEDLMLGVQGDVQNLIVAQPQPSLVPSFAPPANAECGKDGKVQLDIVAQNIAFDPTCLVADAGKPFTINFDNEDAGTPHNIDVFDEQGGTSLASTPVQNGPTKETLNVNALDAGSYFFQCDVHPQQMTGTLAVVK